MATDKSGGALKPGDEVIASLAAGRQNRGPTCNWAAAQQRGLQT